MKNPYLVFVLGLSCSYNHGSHRHPQVSLRIAYDAMRLAYYGLPARFALHALILYSPVHRLLVHVCPPWAMVRPPSQWPSWHMADILCLGSTWKCANSYCLWTSSYWRRRALWCYLTVWASVTWIQTRSDRVIDALAASYHGSTRSHSSPHGALYLCLNDFH